MPDSKPNGPPRGVAKAPAASRALKLFMFSAMTAAVVFAWYMVSTVRADLHARRIAQQAAQSQAAQPVAQTPSEPEKTVAELLEQADKELAAKDFATAAETLQDVISRIGPRSMEALPVLQKRADALTAAGNTSQSAELVYLYALEIHYGPNDERIRRALRGLISAYDLSSDYAKTELLIERYRAFAPESLSANIAADEAVAAKAIADAQERAEKSKTCLCDELDTAQDQIQKDYPMSGYALALVQLKLEEQYDTNVEDSDSTERMLTALGNAEQELGPLDPHLVPILNRLVAAFDAGGDHENADLMLRRLKAINSK